MATPPMSQSPINILSDSVFTEHVSSPASVKPGVDQLESIQLTCSQSAQYGETGVDGTWILDEATGLFNFQAAPPIQAASREKPVLNFFKVLKLVKKIQKSLVRSLKIGQVNLGKSFLCIEGLNRLPVTKLHLRMYPKIIETLKKVKHYRGHGDFQSETLRQKAVTVLEKFLRIFEKKGDESGPQQSSSKHGLTLDSADEHSNRYSEHEPGASGLLVCVPDSTDEHRDAYSQHEAGSCEQDICVADSTMSTDKSVPDKDIEHDTNEEDIEHVDADEEDIEHNDFDEENTEHNDSDEEDEWVPNSSKSEEDVPDKDIEHDSNEEDIEHNDSDEGDIEHNDSDEEDEWVPNSSQSEEDIEHMSDSDEDIGQINVPDSSKSEEDSYYNVQDEVLQEADSTSSKKIQVKLATNLHGKRKWNKKNFCVYCKQPQSKLPRHLERKHMTELLVAKALSFPKRGKERKRLLYEIQNKGDFHHNLQVLENTSGEIVTMKRPSKECSHAEYIPCKYCLAFVKKPILYKHMKRCPCRQEGDQRQRQRCQASSAMLLPIAPDASHGLKKNVLARMNVDPTTMIVKNDSLILKFGSKLYSKHAPEKHMYNHISQKMRELGKVVDGMRNSKKSTVPVVTLTECIQPSCFDPLVDVVKEICGFNEESNKYKTPSLAIKIGHSLKNCAEILEGEGIKKQDSILEKKSKKFLKVYEKQWGYQVSAQARSTLYERKWDKSPAIPVTEDLQKLNKHLDEVCTATVQKLQGKVTRQDWYLLAQSSLAKVVLFNRKRSGEAGRLEVNTLQYLKDPGPMQDDIYQSLSSLEKALVTKMTRLELRGKRGRRVPMLLTPKVKGNIEVLMATRSEAEVLETNNYVFAIPQSESNIRGDRVLHKFATECGAKKPDLLTATNLRKHIATVSQILNLQKNKLDILAKFLGHDINVHREFYRLPYQTLELAKVSRLLIGIDSGEISDFKGKSLEDINYDPDGVFEDEENSDTEEDAGVTLPCQVTSTQACKTWKGTAGLEGETENSEAEEDNASTVTPQVTVTPGPKIRKQTAVKRKWSEAEVTAVDKNLGKFMRLMKVPGKDACQAAIDSNIDLQNRTWRNVKDFVYNKINKRKKLAQ